MPKRKLSTWIAAAVAMRDRDAVVPAATDWAPSSAGELSLVTPPLTDGEPVAATPERLEVESRGTARALLDLGEEVELVLFSPNKASQAAWSKELGSTGFLSGEGAAVGMEGEVDGADVAGAVVRAGAAAATDSDTLEACCVLRGACFFTGGLAAGTTELMGAERGSSAALPSETEALPGLSSVASGLGIPAAESSCPAEASWERPDRGARVREILW